MPLLEPGALVAGYQIESVVGRGGMGVVYRARELDLDRVVALKVIAPELLEAPAIRARFLREARAAASIEHPNVIPVHAAGERDGVAYLVMRFVEGDDLRTLVRRDGPPSPGRVAGVVGDIGEALDAIHRAGLVHRDVKPANVLVDRRGHVYLSDFGLAKQVLSQAGSTATASGQWVGTLDYIAPEQIRGGAVDARADVYALGGLLHFVLTGRVPFERDADEAKLWAQLSDPPPVPSEYRPELPRALDAVVARAMAKAPEDRFPSAGDVGRAVRAAVTGEQPSQPERLVARGAAAPAGALAELEEASTVTAGPRPRRRGRRRIVIAASVVIAGAAATAVALLTADGAPPRAEAPKPPVARTIHVSHRPNGIALAGGTVWVTSSHRTDVERVDATTGRKLEPVRVGGGASSIVGDGDAVWVALKSAHEVVRIERSGRITTRMHPGFAPTRLALGFESLWVAASGTGGADVLVRYRLDGRERSRRTIGHGIVDVTTGHGYVWVAERSFPNVLRLDPESEKLQPWTTLADAISALSESGGGLWATLAAADSVAEINMSRRNGQVTTSIGHRPLRTVAAGGQLYVTVNLDHRVAIVDPKAPQQVARKIVVPPNPYAIAADARYVWVTGVGQDTLTRISYR